MKFDTGHVILNHMIKTAGNSNVGIAIPTFNGPDFVIRQLDYYAKLNFCHCLYYADSSNQENAEKTKQKNEWEK